MTTPGSATTIGASRFQAKHLLFVILGLLTLFVLYKNERFIIDHQSQDWQYYFPVRWWLLPHGLAGATVLFLGASQFSNRLRQRRLRLHRALGRCYVIGVAIAAPLGIYLAIIHDPVPLRTVVFVQASSWMLTTAIAFFCIRSGNVQLHRQWMMRSYAVTTIFVVSRVLDAIPAALGRLDTGTNPSMIWICNVLAWVVPTLILRWPAIFRGETTPKQNTKALPSAQNLQNFIS